MPGPNNPVTSSELSDLGDAVETANNAAVVSLAVYEQSQPPKQNGDVCEDLQTLKERLQDMIAAVNATMADLGCGA